MIGDGKGAAANFSGGQFTAARPFSHIIDGAGQPCQVLFIGVANDWHKQAIGQGDGNANMNPPVEEQPVSGKTAVGFRRVPQRPCNRSHKIGRKGQVDTPFGKARFVGFTMANNSRHIDLENRRHMGAGLFAENHVLGNGAAHGRKRLQGLVGASGRLISRLVAWSLGRLVALLLGRLHRERFG